jgi:hypothetical protein
MEFSKIEVLELARTVADTADATLKQLDDLELALVGGGCGDVAWH